MHKTLRLIAAILMLTAAAVSSAAVPLLKKQAQLPPAEFERILAQAGVLTPQGVAIEAAGLQLHGWAQKNGHGQLVGEDPKVFATRLVAVYGSHLPVAELQQRAAAEQFVIPEGMAVAPVTAASAPTAPAPVVVPATAGAAVPATVTVERDQVDKWAKTTADNGDRLVAQAAAMAALQGKLGSLERQIRAAQAAGADVARLREELSATRAALAEQEEQISAVAAAATKAAENAAALAVQPAFAEAVKTREVAKQAVATATAAEQAAGKVGWLWGALIGFVLLFGFLIWRVMRQVVKKAELTTLVEKVVKPAAAAAGLASAEAHTKSLNLGSDAARKAADEAMEKAKLLGNDIVLLRGDVDRQSQVVDRHGEILEGHTLQLEAAGAAVDKPLSWQIAAEEAAAIKADVAALTQVGTRSNAPLLISLPDGKPVGVGFEVVAEDRIRIYGILTPTGQRPAVVARDNVLSALRKAYFAGRLTGLPAAAAVQKVA